MKNMIMYKEGEDSYIRWIKKRIRNNLNFLSVFEGPTGIGKSWVTLRIAYEIDNEFDVHEQVAFSFIELMRIINKMNGTDPSSPKLFNKKYKVIIFDEVQVSLSNRSWQSKVNKLFNYLLTTFRHQNIILLFTSPFSDFIDSASMKLLHAKFEVKGWNKRTQITTLRPKLLQYNSQMRKFYYHSLMIIKEKKTKKLIIWDLKRPPESLTIPYEEDKKAFTTKLNKGILEELEQDERKEAKKLEAKNEKRKPLTERQEQVMRLLANTKATNKVQSVAKIMATSMGNVSNFRHWAEKKGYNLKEFEESAPIS